LVQGVYTECLLSLPRRKGVGGCLGSAFAWAWGFDGSSSAVETFGENILSFQIYFKILTKKKKKKKKGS
jgi:hypothetical protein